MRPYIQHVAIAIVIAIGLPSIYGQVQCEQPSFPSILAPTEGEVIPASGSYTASVAFNAVLTAMSEVQLEIQTDVDAAGGPTIIPVNSLFLGGASDFTGQTGATADIDPVALGLVPGEQRLFFSLDTDGPGTDFTPAVRVRTFTWNGGTPLSCEEAVGAALSTCFGAVSDATRLCYLGTGSACTPSDPTITSAESLLRASIGASCSDSEVQSLEFGMLMTSNTLADRLVESCKGNAATLAARMFGGPHAKELDGSSAPCLGPAYAESASFLNTAFNLQRDCVLDGAACDPVTVASDIDTAASASEGAIDTVCPFEVLEAFVGVPAEEAVARARTQSECMTSVAHGDTGELTLKCAPSALPPGVVVVGTQPSGLTAFDPGVPTQVLLDEAVWGTKCGDGSPYAFWIQMPPAGSSPANVVVRLQGGGVCVTQQQCQGVQNGNPGLFEALNDGFSANGVFSDDPAESDFAAWTKVFLPYCNQDVFTGGGVLQTYGNGLTVERYGAVNTRAALRALRNIVSQELNETTTEGYRPDLIQMLFSGTSAGGFGVMFNMHHVLDEERWVNTVTLNDSALGLDSTDTGGPFSIVFIGDSAQGEWATRLTQPPYCLAAMPREESCVVGPILNAAHSERLLGTPTQQLLILSNQVDNTQINTTGFSDIVSFVTEAREQYCATNSLPGVRFFLDADPSNIHVFLTGSRYYTFDIAGTTVADWVEQSFGDPGNLPNLAEEGTLTTAYPGVPPFGCPVN